MSFFIAQAKAEEEEEAQTTPPAATHEHRANE